LRARGGGLSSRFSSSGFFFFFGGGGVGGERGNPEIESTRARVVYSPPAGRWPSGWPDGTSPSSRRRRPAGYTLQGATPRSYSETFFTPDGRRLAPPADEQYRQDLGHSRRRRDFRAPSRPTRGTSDVRTLLARRHDPGTRRQGCIVRLWDPKNGMGDGRVSPTDSELRVAALSRGSGSPQGTHTGRSRLGRGRKPERAGGTMKKRPTQVR